MKLLLAVVFLLVVMAWAVFAALPPPPNIAIIWGYSQPTTNTVFKVYGTTNLAQNITNWPVVATFTNWSTVSVGTYSNNFFSPPASSFFTMTASNFWGEGPFFAPQFVASPASNILSQSLNYIGP